MAWELLLKNLGEHAVKAGSESEGEVVNNEEQNGYLTIIETSYGCSA